MRIAVFSDVHANLTALRAALEDISAHGPFHLVVSNGDQLVGGPRPIETWNELRRQGVYTLLGNTERDLGVGEFSTGTAKGRRRDLIVEVFEWTLEGLSPQVRAAAASLPRELRLQIDEGPALLVTHANAANLDDFIWADTEPAELDRLVGRPAPGLLVVGHIHASLELEFDSTRIVRPGSVGLKYEPHWYNVAHWVEVAWEDTRREWISQIHTVTWDHRAEIEAGQRVGYPGVEILPGFDRS